MANTVNVMITHVSLEAVNCALGMAYVSVGNVSVMQTGLMRLATVHFLQMAVEPVKGVKSALVMVTAAAANAVVIHYIQENIAKLLSLL